MTPKQKQEMELAGHVGFNINDQLDWVWESERDFELYCAEHNIPYTPPSDES